MRVDPSRSPAPSVSLNQAPAPDSGFWGLDSYAARASSVAQISYLSSLGETRRSSALPTTAAASQADCTVASADFLESTHQTSSPYMRLPIVACTTELHDRMRASLDKLLAGLERGSKAIYLIGEGHGSSSSMALRFAVAQLTKEFARAAGRSIGIFAERRLTNARLFGEMGRSALASPHEALTLATLHSGYQRLLDSRSEFDRQHAYNAMGQVALSADGHIEVRSVEPFGPQDRTYEQREKSMVRNIQSQLKDSGVAVFIGGARHVLPMAKRLERAGCKTDHLIVLDTGSNPIQAYEDTVDSVLEFVEELEARREHSTGVVNVVRAARDFQPFA